MFSNPSPIAGFSYPSGSNGQQFINPREMEMVMKQKWNEPQQVSNPYNDYIQELNSASPTVRNKILQTQEYNDIDAYCENLIKQAIYETIIPQLVNTQQGRNAFERLSFTTKKLKDYYTQEEVATNEQLQMLMKDEVVIKRLKELQKNESPKENQTHSSIAENKENS